MVCKGCQSRLHVIEEEQDRRALVEFVALMEERMGVREEVLEVVERVEPAGEDR